MPASPTVGVLDSGIGFDDAINRSRNIDTRRPARTSCRFRGGMPAPLNVVMGLAGRAMSVGHLADLGVRRVSIGGSLARATLGPVRRAADEILREGSFGCAEGQIADGELCELFAGRLARRERST